MLKQIFTEYKHMIQLRGDTFALSLGYFMLNNKGLTDFTYQFPSDDFKENSKMIFQYF